MIDKECLEHSLQEIEYQLRSIRMEISREKLPVDGVSLEATATKKAAYVSFGYLREKSEIIGILVNSIRSEMEREE